MLDKNIMQILLYNYKNGNFYASILPFKFKIKLILFNNEFYTIFRSNLTMENERNSVAVSNGHHYVHLNRKKNGKKIKIISFLIFCRQHPGKNQKELQDG